MDLADRGRGEGLLVEVGERPRQRLAEIRLGDLADRLERDRLGRVLKLGEDLLHLGPELLGHEAEVDSRKGLTHLHRGAPHPAEHSRQAGARP